MDSIFRALDDRGRRALLDSLYEADGKSLKELCDVLPDMTRQGVMNHLDVLAEANLVTNRKAGREKLHFLNRVPIQQLHDRWMNRYTQPLAEVLSALTNQLEGEEAMSIPTYVYETYIRCEPEAAWKAIVAGDMTRQYFYGTRVESTWEEGAAIRYLAPDGSAVAEGEVLAIDAPNRLELTFLALWDPALADLGPVRQAWVVEAADGATKVSVEYYDIATDDPRLVDFAQGIPLIVAGMKTLLETGAPMMSSSS